MKMLSPRQALALLLALGVTQILTGSAPAQVRRQAVEDLLTTKAQANVISGVEAVQLRLVVDSLV